MGKWLLCILVLGGSAACGSDLTPCEEQVQAEEACGLYRPDRGSSCADPHLACAIVCYSGLGCAEMDALFIDDAPYPVAVSRCLWACSDGFECDGNPPNTAIRPCNGFIDCKDASDELGCSYFECDDGQLVSEGARCDDYDECMDGSDETDC